MPIAFLLRFQELCDDSPSDVRAGTKTGTRVRAEQPDTDVGAATCSTLPRMSAASGVIRSASDRQSGSAGTRTKIRREQPDYGAEESATRAVPWPDTAALTKTTTAVRAEADDNDPRRASLDAIPRCF
jgi:hypothetical protein